MKGQHILILGAGALLLGAIGFQYLADMYPCPLCMTQRWWHVAAIVAAILALPQVTVMRPARAPLFLIAITLRGIYGGIFTPTEAAAVAAVYAFYIANVIY